VAKIVEPKKTAAIVIKEDADIEQPVVLPEAPSSPPVLVVKEDQNTEDATAPDSTNTTMPGTTFSQAAIAQLEIP